MRTPRPRKDRGVQKKHKSHYLRLLILLSNGIASMKKHLPRQMFFRVRVGTGSNFLQSKKLHHLDVYIDTRWE